MFLRSDIVSYLFDMFIKLIQDAIVICYNASAAVGIANYGIAIILFTFLVKILLYPITIKQIKSTKAMQEIQPKMKALQEKYKNDKVRLQQEMVNLYRETGFNPLAGCLPLLLQMPILMGIFFALRDFNYGPVAPSFLWMPSLASPDPLFIMPVISAVTTLIQTKQSMPDTSSSQNKMMLYFMPIFIGYISLQFPSGLVIYWSVTNLLQIFQQMWFNHLEAKNSVRK